MPANYVLLAKNVVGAAGASSVTFSNIPQTGYTDLLVKVSADYSDDSVLGRVRFNSDDGLNYSMRRLYATGSTAASNSATSSNRFDIFGLNNPTGYTSNVFSNAEFYIPNYTSSTFKSVSVDAVTENNGIEAYGTLHSGIWSNTAAITSITFFQFSSSFIQNSTFYLYGVAKAGVTPTVAPYATGGDTVTNDGTYFIHTFRTSGTFTPKKALSNVDYLVVAGGGGGGQTAFGGGGGAGGLRSTVTATGGGGSLGSLLSLAGGTGYTVTVGAGGAASTTGSNSVFSTITSNGGGGGGYYFNVDAKTGGSGGGGAGGDGTKAGAAGTANQGYAGGSGNDGAPTYAARVGGGGGGAGAVGANAVASVSGGNGGAGVAVSISGSSVTYGGGGGGSDQASASSGPGAGGAGGGGGGGDGTTPGVAGTANTGGGGGGAGNGTGSAGGAGGSGIVIVRYPI